MQAISKAFGTLDEQKEGSVALGLIKCHYNARGHPEVKEGRRLEEDVLVEFMDTLDTHHKYVFEEASEDKVTVEEFEDYYTYFSSLYDGDKEFCAILGGTWTCNDIMAALFESVSKKPKGEAPVPLKKKKEAKTKGKTIVKRPKDTAYIGEAKRSYKQGASNKPSPDNVLPQKAKLAKRDQIFFELQQEIADLRESILSRGLRVLIGVARQLIVRIIAIKL